MIYTPAERTTKVNRVKTMYQTAYSHYVVALEKIEQKAIYNEDEGDFVKAFECGEALYGAVEESLRIILSDNDKEVKDKGNTTYQLCFNAWQYIKHIDYIDLACLVVEKEERNLAYHRFSVAKLSRFVRVFKNLKNIIHLFFDKNANLPDVEEPKNLIDFSKIYFECEEFKLSDCTYMLIADPMHDIAKDKLSILTSLPWDVVIDFDGASKQNGLRASVSVDNDPKIIDLFYDNVRKGVNPETTMFKSGKTIWFYENRRGKIIPQMFSKWNEEPDNTIKRKDSSRIFLETCYSARPTQLIVVCLKRYDQAVRFLLEELYERFNDIKVILINQDDEEEERRILDILPEEKFSFYLNGIDNFLDKLKANRNKLPTQPLKRTRGILVSGKKGEVELESNFVVNIQDYFDIVHLNIDKDEGEIDLESAKLQFMKGHPASWSIYKHNIDVHLVDVELLRSFLGRIKERLNIVAHNPKDRIFTIAHRPGFGGTTLSKRIAWELHYDYPVLILKNYKQGRISKLISDLYDESNKGILIVADENVVGVSGLDDFEREISSINRPIATLLVKRDGKNTRNDNKNTLPLRLIEDGVCEILEERYISIARQTYDDGTIQRQKKYLSKISDDMKCPFIIGLYYLEKDFTGVKDYVRKFVSKINDQRTKKVLLYISMCDYFARKEVPTYLISRIFTDQEGRFVLRNVIGASTEELLIEKNENNLTYWRPKHYLLGFEILKWLMSDMQYDEKDWRDRLYTYSKSFIDDTKRIVGNSEYILDLLSEMFINRQVHNSVEDGEDGRFSKLIDTIVGAEERLQILQHLTNSYDNVAHFWGHLARYYSSRKPTNFIKAEKCCDTAIRLTEETGKNDPVIYHIKGDCIRKNMSDQIKSSMNSGDKIDIDKILEIRSLVDYAATWFELSKKYGQVDFGVITHIETILEFMELVFKHYSISSVADLLNLKETWVKNYIKDLNDLFLAIDKDELSEKALEIYERCKNKFNILIYRKSHSEIIQGLYNRLGDFKNRTNVDTHSITFIRRSIIETILHNYEQNFDRIDDRDRIRLLELLEANIDAAPDNTSNYRLWIKISKQSKENVDKAIIYVRKWYNVEKEKRVRDPKPAYYMFVLHFLRAMDGFRDALEDALIYLKECQLICEYRQKFISINVVRVRDWYGYGTGMKRIIDANSVSEAELNKDARIAEMHGIFSKYEHNGKGYISLDTLKGIDVFFKPSDAKRSLGQNQVDDNLLFKFGFSYDGLIAYNKSVEDLDGKNEENILEESLKVKKSTKLIKVGEVVDFYIREKRGTSLLLGTIRDGNLEGCIHISEIKYGKTTQEEMEELINKTVKARIVEKDSKDRYRLSLKQLYGSKFNSTTEEDNLIKRAYEKAKRKKKR